MPFAFGFCATNSAPSFQSLLNSTITALEQKDFSKLQAQFAVKEPVIVLASKRFADMNTLKFFWDEQMRAGLFPVKDIVVQPVGELLVESLCKKYAVLSGSSKVRIRYKNNDVKQVLMFFTTVVKRQDKNKAWQIVSFHSSNEKITGSNRVHTYHIAAGAMLLGLALGAALLVALRRLDSGITDA